MKQFQVTIVKDDEETTKVVQGPRGLVPVYAETYDLEVGDAITINRIDDVEEGEL